jgi:hypothetical protein
VTGGLGSPESDAAIGVGVARLSIVLTGLVYIGVQVGRGAVSTCGGIGAGVTGM